MKKAPVKQLPVKPAAFKPAAFKPAAFKPVALKPAAFKPVAVKPLAKKFVAGSAAPVRKVRTPAADRQLCPKCGRHSALVFGRSEVFPVCYLKCEACHDVSVAPA